MYNVALRCVVATIVTVEKQYYIFWVCVCISRYPACKAHAPYCYLWPAHLYNVFAHYLINDTIFVKWKLLYLKCVSFRKMEVVILEMCQLSLQLLSETFFFLRSEQHMIESVYCIALDVRYRYCSWCTVPLLLLMYGTVIALDVRYRYCSWCTVPLLLLMYGTVIALDVRYRYCSWCTVPLLLSMYGTVIALDVRYRYSCQTLTIHVLSRQIFEKYWNI